MKKLRATIDQYSGWQGLGQYIDRMEGHLESDFSVSIENAKAMLESIGKEICGARNVELPASASVNAVLKKAFTALGYPNEGLVKKVSGSLANIAQEIGTLRNEISPTSHGKSLDELRERNSKVDVLTREFLIDSTVVVAIFLIRAFEERQEKVETPSEVAIGTTSIHYDEAEDFNEFWDDAYGEFAMGDYAYTASEILFGVDYKAYETECIAFRESEPAEEPGEET